MLARMLSRATLLAAVPAILLLGCAGEPSTGPNGPDFAKGVKPSGRVSLANLVLESTTLVIDGTAANYTVDVVNDGGKLAAITVQGTLTQPGIDGAADVLRGAGGTEVQCGGGGGVLPHGTCNVRFTAQAQNDPFDPRMLVAGPATFRLAVIDGQGRELAVIEVAVTLQ